MRYRYGRGVTKKPTTQKIKKRVITAGITLLSATYLGVLATAPIIAAKKMPPDQIARTVTSRQPAKTENHLYLPTINSKIEFDSKDNTAIALTLERGTLPGKGKRVYAEAPQYSLGITPDKTIANSPLLRAGQLNTDDEIFLDYQGTRYVYRIVRKQPAKSQPDTGSHAELTLFARSWNEHTAGVVIEAEAIGTVSWKGNTATIVPYEEW